MMSVRVLIPAICLAGLTTPAFAEDWLQFRGDGTGVSHEKGLPTTWSGDKNILWKAKATGRGWASPVVYGDKVIIVAAASERDAGGRPMGKGGFGGGGGRGRAPDVDYKWTITCLDRNTGKELWKKTALEAKPKIPTHGSNTYASETPITDGERIYVYYGMTGLFCFDMEGKELWKKDLGSFRMQANWGTSSSPVLEGDRLFLQIDNEEKSFLIALDKKTGKELWKVDRNEKTTWSSPIIWKNKTRTELVTAGQKMRSYDPATGKILWELNLGSGRASATPVADEDRLYFGLGSGGGGGGGGRGKGGFNPPGGGGGRSGGGGSLFAVKAGASGDITPKSGETTSAGVEWSQPKAGAEMSSPLAYQGYIYILARNGMISCYDAKTGKPSYDKERLPGARSFWASPWAYDGKIFCLDGEGNTHVLKAGPKLEIIGKNTINDQFWASPAIAGGTLILRGVNSIYAVKQ